MTLGILGIFVAKSCEGNYSNGEIFRCDTDDRDLANFSEISHVRNRFAVLLLFDIPRRKFLLISMLLCTYLCESLRVAHSRK
jgi:hypothetical protein